jgi:glycine cleavage system regulatory protein
MPLSVAQLKRKLRQLKQLELTIRFGRQPAPKQPALVWTVFFSTRADDPASVKYPLSRLLQMDHQELKAVFDEYFFRVYAQTDQDQGLMHADVYDPQLLALLELPAYAGIAEIKQRFRALAKRYHPDHGGTSAQFIELVALYERLTHESH